MERREFARKGQNEKYKRERREGEGKESRVKTTNVRHTKREGRNVGKERERKNTE